MNAQTEHPHTAALRQILSGCKVRGRWIDQTTFDCPSDCDEHNPDVAPPGCEWEPYSEEETELWLDGVVALCEEALNKTLPS